MLDQAKTKNQLIDELNEMRRKITLRDVAENKLRKSQCLPSELEEKTSEEIIHELRVHQIELEMQNEELKRIQLVLEASTNKYQDLYDFAPVGYFTLTHKGIIKDVNLAGAALLGMPRANLINRGFGYFIAPESLHQWDNHIITVLGNKDIQSCDITLNSPEGSTLYVRLDSIQTDASAEMQAANGENHAIRMSVTDITERKLAEKALRESEAQKQAILDGITTNIAFVNQDMEILWANKTAANSVGKLPSQMIGHKCHSLWADDAKPCDGCPTLKAFKTKKSEHTTMVTPDGRVWDEKGEPVFDSEGSLLGVVEIATDITEKVHAEQEKLALQAQLFQSQKVEALGTLVGGIAHDFNNMLQIMIGYCDLLLDDKKKGEPGYRELQAVIETGKGGADLVKKMLAFSQQGQVFPVPLDLNLQIRELIPLISRTLPQLVKIDFDLTDGPVAIHADPSQIDQVVMDLAINASEAMSNGGRLKVATKTVSLDDEYRTSHPGVKPGEYVMLSVLDAGRGMDKETLAKAFDPFFSTKQRGSTKGTGLGLSVAQGIVQQQGGHITCESEPGKGTEFKVYFPAIEAPLRPPKTVAPKIKSGGTETILVVEDTLFVAELEEQILTNAGYTVIMATRGQEALDIYSARKDEISLVILDLIMPEMSGRDCLKELLKIDPSVKVLIASGYAPEDELHKEISPLVKGFLHKPFTIAELLNEARSVLDND